MEQEQTLDTTAPEVFPLDQAAIDLLAELDKHIQPLLLQQNTILGYFARQHKLEGRWQLAPNREELIKAP